ncbi:uncharacterized protein LOC117116502 [Anneissia japonica]|uniref:uncharacterized protein LOC117116502 n=1 Tax=Anneissia japonica TaxID=1529436 RepID=UPI0014256EB4|nr:uncharacterized protein LOC117116502 [Anneissia japonica]
MIPNRDVPMGSRRPLYQIVYYRAPRDVVDESLKSATTEAVDFVDNWIYGRRDCILHHIAKLGYAQEMRKSLTISARNVNLQDKYKETPLHNLLKAKHKFRDYLNIARLLLDAGADVNIKNEDNETPRDLYIQNECEEYDSTNREKHKEEVLQLLQGIAVPEVIMARGEAALKVFNEELEDGKITVNHARLMVTGKEGVGKTCLVNTLLEKPFNEAEPSTDGIVLTTAFQTTDVGCKWKETEDMDECERIKLIYDNELEGRVAEKLKLKGNQTEGVESTPQPALEPALQPEPSPLPAPEPAPQPAPEPAPPPASLPAPAHMPKTTRTQKLIRHVFSPFSKKRRKGKPSSTLECDVMSGPIDAEHKEVSSQALPSEIQERVVDRITGKTSQAIDNKDMTYIWDFAGQQLYYITHRIFLTSEAVYVILFNLLESMYEKGKKRVYKGDKNVMTYDMTNIQIIKYWMRLIYTYAVPVESQQQRLQAKKPQIVVVGTHSESLPGTDDEKKEKIEEQFGIIFEAIKGTPYECHVVRKIYAIDNKSQIQSEMLTTLKQDVGGFLKAMPKTIPLKWLEFQRILQENGRTAVRMTHDEVCAVATKCGLSVKNLIHTLNYLHDLGIILYFENNRLLKHTVITNPRKLIDIFKKIITVVEPHDSEKWATMIELWNKLDEEGILEEELVRHLWRDELAKDESSFEVFLELMKQFGLLCEQIKNQESKHRSFFVPCRLKRSKDNVSIQLDTAQMVSIYMASEDFIPDSVFHPLVVSLIGMVQDMGYTAMLELFSNYANIRLGLEHTLSLGPVVINNKPSLKLEILRVPITQEDGTKTPTGEPSPRVCMQVF